jgi:hypothetical protein
VTNRCSLFSPPSHALSFPFDTIVFKMDIKELKFESPHERDETGYKRARQLQRNLALYGLISGLTFSTSSPSLVPHPPTMSPLGPILEQTQTISARRPREDLKRTVYMSLPLPFRREGSDVAMRRSVTIGPYYTCLGTQASRSRPPLQRPRAHQEIHGTMFMEDCHPPLLLWPTPGELLKEGVGEGSHHHGVGVCSSYILLLSFLLFPNLCTIYK